MSKYILALIALFLVTESEGQLYINELVACNQNGIEDDFFQAEDWIEIHNTGGIVNINLKWMMLSSQMGFHTGCLNLLDQNTLYLYFEILEVSFRSVRLTF